VERNLFQNTNMKVSSTLKEEINTVVNRHVPFGKDPILHVDRRKIMVNIIEKYASQGVVPLNRVNLLYLAKSWNSILHQRAQLSN